MRRRLTVIAGTEQRTSNSSTTPASLCIMTEDPSLGALPAYLAFEGAASHIEVVPVLLQKGDDLVLRGHRLRTGVPGHHDCPHSVAEDRGLPRGPPPEMSAEE